MLNAAVPRRGPVETFRGGFRYRNHVGDTLRLDGWMHQQQVGNDASQEHRLEVFARVVRKFGKQKRIHRIGSSVIQDGVTIRRSLGHHRSTDRTCGAATVVDDELLTKIFTELAEQQAANRIRPSSSRVRHNHANRFGRIGTLRPCINGLQDTGAKQSTTNLQESAAIEPAAVGHRLSFFGRLLLPA